MYFWRIPNQIKYFYTFLLLLLYISTYSQNVAITEFLADPIGVENDNEWVEIYNYGTTTVNLKDWKLKDEDNNNAIISSVDLFIEPDTFLILTNNKSAFQDNWLNSCENSKVIQVAFDLDNSADEIILEDNSFSPDIIWSLAYSNDSVEGFATHYTENAFTTTVFGSKATPGINRTGNDVSGTLGYQINTATIDAKAYLSANGNSGSPLNIDVLDFNRGNSITLDGVNDYIDLGETSALENTSEFTFEAWINPITIDTNTERIFSKRSSNSTRIELSLGNGSADSNRQYIRINVNNGFSQTIDSPNLSVPIAIWTHIAVVFDGSLTTNKLKLYANGIRQTLSGDTSATTTPTGNGVAYIGKRSDNTSKNSNIQIDEVRLWNTARTEQLIRENMHLTLNNMECGLVSYFQFNEANGTTISDKTNSNNATAINGASFSQSNINTGNSVSSNSETITGIGTTGIQNFTNAFLAINYTHKTETEDVTVTFSDFVPNTLNGVDSSISVLDNQTWTLNTSKASGTYTGDLTFTVPNGFVNTTLTPENYTLYSRTMNSEDNWTAITTASGSSASSLTFSNITNKGQFIISQTSGSVLSAESINNFNNSISTYPNPTTDILNIKTSNIQLTKVEIYSVFGEKIKVERNNLNEVDLTNLSNGLYLVKIYTEKGSVIKKIIKK